MKRRRDFVIALGSGLLLPAHAIFQRGLHAELFKPKPAAGGSDAALAGYLSPFYPTTLYSMRKRNSSYSGNCIKVRNGTSNVETDIGFGADGWISVAALNVATGQPSGGADSLFVTTWYDQSGGGVNAVNATSATQPRIANFGSIDLMQGKPAIYWRPGGVAAKLAVAADAAFGFGTGAWTVEAYCKTESVVSLSGENGPIVNLRSGGTGNNPGELYMSSPSDGTKLHWYDGGDYTGAGNNYMATNTDYVLSAAYVGGPASAFKAFINGAVEITTNLSDDFTSSRQLTLANDSSGSFKGLFGEIAITKGLCQFTAAHTPRSYL